MGAVIWSKDVDFAERARLQTRASGRLAEARQHDQCLTPGSGWPPAWKLWLPLLRRARLLVEIR